MTQEQETTTQTQPHTGKEKSNSTPPPQKTEAQIQARRKFIATSIAIIVGCSLLAIFYWPKSTDTIEQQGFNTDIPQALDSEMVDDKLKAYELQDLEKRRSERQGIQDLASIFTEEEQQKSANMELSPQEKSAEQITNSVDVYRQTNQSVGRFYAPRNNNSKNRELEQKIKDLETQLQAAQNTPKTPDAMEIMERSYELAAKYMGDKNEPDPLPKGTKVERNGKAIITTISRKEDRTVSNLPQEISSQEFAESMAQPRNYNFVTAVGAQITDNPNTIAACVDNDQIITNGKSVRLRLLNEMRAGHEILPIGSVIVGVARINAERLEIEIKSLQIKGVILQVELDIYDSDGQKGLFIPNSSLRNAAKDIAASMGRNIGTSYSVNNNSVGEQLLTEMGKSVIQGTSQFIASKMQEVRVHLKEGYRVLIYQPK